MKQPRMDTKLCKDCEGFCCDDIGLQISPDELQESYHAWLRETSIGKPPLSMEDISMAHNQKGLRLWNEIYLIYPMLEFLYHDHIHPDGEIDFSKEKDIRIIYHYRCKHHNKKTGDCDIYEERPMMCRTFPDTGYCGYKKVKDKRVIAYRPEWFNPGMPYYDWYYAQHPEENEKEL
jgi:Fe-S-cluster containining protein